MAISRSRAHAPPTIATWKTHGTAHRTSFAVVVRELTKTGCYAIDHSGHKGHVQVALVEQAVVSTRS